MHGVLIALLVVACVLLGVVPIVLLVFLCSVHTRCRHVWKILWQWPPEYKLAEKFLRNQRKAMIVMVCERCGETQHKAA